MSASLIASRRSTWPAPGDCHRLAMTAPCPAPSLHALHSRRKLRRSIERFCTHIRPASLLLPHSVVAAIQTTRPQAHARLHQVLALFLVLTAMSRLMVSLAVKYGILRVSAGCGPLPSTPPHPPPAASSPFLSLRGMSPRPLLPTQCPPTPIARSSSHRAHKPAHGISAREPRSTRFQSLRAGGRRS